jgi:RNA recognition motif-containing protein
MYGVFVGGLGESSEAEVRDIFTKFGEIESVKIIRESIGVTKPFFRL